MRHKGAWHPPVAGLAPGLKFRLAGLGSSPLSTVPREALRFCFPLFFIKKESFTRATGLAATYFSVLSPLFPDLPCAAQAAGHFGPWASLALSRCFCLSPSFSVDLSLFLLLIPSSPTPGPGIAGQSQSLLGASSSPPITYSLPITCFPLCGSSFLPVF